MVCRRFLVSGRVQGVGFRNFVQKRALDLGVRGVVRNLFDGRVEILAQADDLVMSEFRLAVSRGPVLAQVLDMKDSGVGDPARILAFLAGGPAGTTNDFLIVSDGEEPWSVDS
jgi:acylphosphatase